MRRRKREADTRDVSTRSLPSVALRPMIGRLIMPSGHQLLAHVRRGALNDVGGDGATLLEMDGV